MTRSLESVNRAISLAVSSVDASSMTRMSNAWLPRCCRMLSRHSPTYPAVLYAWTKKLTRPALLAEDIPVPSRSLLFQPPAHIRSALEYPPQDAAHAADNAGFHGLTCRQ